MKLETFSYLPPMTARQVGKQLQYLFKRKLIPGIEYARPAEARERYWNMWKLPLFDTRAAEDVLAEIEACKAAHPDAYVKLVGYDRDRQSQALSFVVHHP